LKLVLAWLLVSAWWLNLLDALVTWYGYTFFGMRESNEMLGACIRKFGLTAIMVLKIAAFTWVVGSLLWLDTMVGHSSIFASSLLVAASLMVTIFAAAVTWNVWLTYRKFTRRIRSS